MRALAAYVAFFAFFMFFIFPALNYFTDPLNYFSDSDLFLRRHLRHTKAVRLLREKGADGVLMGTSFSMNFFPSEMKRILGQSVVNMAFENATLPEQSVMLRAFLAAHPETHTVYWELDSLFNPSRTLPAENDFPQLLMGGGPLSLGRYLMGGDISNFSVEKIRTRLGLMADSPYLIDVEENWGWANQFPFRFHRPDLTLHVIRKQMTATRDLPLKAEQLAPWIAGWLMPVLKNHPDRRFVLYFAPKQVELYRHWRKRGLLSLWLARKEALLESLTGMPHVAVFDFSAMEKAVLDAGLFIDFGHFHTDVNRFMLTGMKGGEGRVTVADFPAHRRRFLTMVGE